MKKNATRTLLYCAALSLLFAGQAMAQAPYVNKIPIPALIDWTNNQSWTFQARQTLHDFNPAVPSSPLNGVTTWSYDTLGGTGNTYLGPTMQWWQGDNINTTMNNGLTVPTTTHWHGLELPAVMDGGPQDSVLVGGNSTTSFVQVDAPATAWYHPHLHNETFPHVEMGLSGIIIIRNASDPIEAGLPHSYGSDDFPIVLQDKNFLPQTGAASTISVAKGKRPTNVVNGVVQPFLQVPAHEVRLRILNGSSRKAMRYGLAYNESDTATMIPMYQVATDGGYTVPGPNVLDSMLMAPGERVEFVLNLEGLPEGKILYMRNLKRSLPGDMVGSPHGRAADTTAGASFFQLRIVSDDSFPIFTPVTTVPSFTTVWDPTIADSSNLDFQRTKNLVGINNGSGFTIDGSAFEMNVINDIICEGAKEMWTIDNQTNISHPFHIHKIAFRIVEMTDNTGHVLSESELAAMGLNGPKDDVFIQPQWKVKFVAKFDDYGSDLADTNAYMYHCHILTHEDAEGGGMMHQFIVSNLPGCQPFVGQPEPVAPKGMTLYPNPSTGALFLQGECAKPSSVRICDLLGRPLRFQALRAFSGSIPLDVAGLPRGLHIVEWQAADGVHTSKVMLH